MPSNSTVDDLVPFSSTPLANINMFVLMTQIDIITPESREVCEQWRNFLKSPPSSLLLSVVMC